MLVYVSWLDRFTGSGWSCTDVTFRSTACGPTSVFTLEWLLSVFGFESGPLTSAELVNGAVSVPPAVVRILMSDESPAAMLGRVQLTLLPLDAEQWLVCTLMASAVLWYGELRKLLARALP